MLSTCAYVCARVEVGATYVFGVRVVRVPVFVHDGVVHGVGRRPEVQIVVSQAASWLVARRIEMRTCSL